MYMWNNIFFSLAFDGRDHYKEFGGDNAAHVAAVSHDQLAKDLLQPVELHVINHTH